MSLWGPLKIKHRHKFLRFRFDDLMPDDLHGEYDPLDNSIRINPKFGNPERHFTQVHELLHAISEAYKLNLTEAQVHGIENALANIYRYNIGFSLDPPKLRRK